ncbi:MAG: V-type ATPase subunit [Candidatus Syntropharchaeia archaeon]
MSVSKYAYVNAKVKAIMSDLLGEREIRSLVEAGSAKEMVSILMNTPYREEISSLPADASLVSIERAFKENLVETYIRVIRSTKDEVRNLLTEILRKFEVENIKRVLRAKISGVSEEIVFFPVEKFFGRRFSKLTEVASIEELIGLLEGTIYRKILEEALPEYKKEKKAFPLEIALDNQLFISIWKKIEKLSPEDRSYAKNLLGTMIDCANIMTILRCKEEDIEIGELKKYLLPIKFRFDFDTAKDFVMAEDVKTAVLSLPLPYGKLLSEAVPVFEAEKSLFPLEWVLENHLLGKSRKVMSGYPFQIGTVIGFFNIKEVEVKNLCTIAICKENGIPPEEIRRYIIA